MSKPNRTLEERIDDFVDDLLVKYGIDDDTYTSQLHIECTTPHCHPDQIDFPPGVAERHALAFVTRQHPEHDAVMAEFDAGIAALKCNQCIGTFVDTTEAKTVEIGEVPPAREAAMAR